MSQDIDPPTLELLERRLVDSISKAVRVRLFAAYVTVGVAVGAVLGYVGINVFSEVERKASEIADKLIKDKVEPASKVADDAEKRMTIQYEVLIKQNEVLSKLQTRAEKTFDELDSKLAAFAPKMATLDTLISTVTDLDTRSKNLKIDLDTATQNIGSLAELSAKVAALAEQLNALNDLVKSRDPTADKHSYDSIAKVTNEISSTSAKVSQTLQQANKATRVWFQYAGVPTEQAQAVADGLRNKGFIVPGIQRVTARGLNEIRYYWVDDRGGADELAKAASELLRKVVGENRSPRLADYTFWPSTKPKEGTIELWYSPSD